MTEKELIKQEIKRRISYIEELGDREYIEEYFEEQFRFIEIYESLIEFIDSLQEESKCIYNRTLEERKKFCKYCSAFCTVRINEEPASEDLEEAAKK